MSCDSQEVHHPIKRKLHELKLFKLTDSIRLDGRCLTMSFVQMCFISIIFIWEGKKISFFMFCFPFFAHVFLNVDFVVLLSRPDFHICLIKFYHVISVNLSSQT